MKPNDFLRSIEIGVGLAKGSQEEHNNVSEVRSLKESISPELYGTFVSIVKDIGLFGKKSSAHHERRIVKIDDDVDLVRRINDWSDSVTREVGVQGEDIDEIKQTIFLYMHAVADGVNGLSLSKDIREQFREAQRREGELGDMYYWAQGAVQKEFESSLLQKYAQLGITRDDISFLLKELEGYEQKNKPHPAEAFTAAMRIFKHFDLRSEVPAALKLAIAHSCIRVLSLAKPYVWTSFEFKPEHFEKGALLPPAMYAGIAAFESALSAKMRIIQEELNYRIREKIREEVLGSVMLRNVDLHGDLQEGELQRIIDSGPSESTWLLHDIGVDLVPGVVGLASTLAFLCMIHPALALAVASTLPLTVPVENWRRKRQTAAWQRGAVLNQSADTEVAELFRAIEAVQSADRLEALRMANTKHARAAKIQKDDAIEDSKFGIVEDIIGMYPKAMSALVGYMLFKNGMIPPGAMISSVLYGTELGNTLKNMWTEWTESIPKRVEVVQKMFERIGEGAAKELAADQSRLPVSMLQDASIVVEGLSYKNILRNVHFSVPSGAFMVLRGPSGDGKTTLLRLLRGTYTIESGTMAIAGVDTREIKKIGNEGIDSFMVSSTQDPPIFASADIRENLKFIRGDIYTDEEYRRVLRVVGLDKRFSNLDEKPSHNTISGGERKRFGLARVLLRVSRMKKGIVLLDEPTSSLDEETKTSIIEELTRLQVKKPELTVIAISHDKELYTAIRADGEPVISVKLSELEQV